jgi:hypothetical protein
MLDIRIAKTKTTKECCRNTAAAVPSHDDAIVSQSGKAFVDFVKYASIVREAGTLALKTEHQFHLGIVFLELRLLLGRRVLRSKGRYAYEQKPYRN